MTGGFAAAGLGAATFLGAAGFFPAFDFSSPAFTGEGRELEAQAMSLADHGVATDAAKIFRDLTRGRSLGPHRLQAIDAFFGPGHENSKLACGAPPVPIGDCPMMSQPPTNNGAARLRSQPGEPTLSGVNWGGLKTLYIKEVRRFFKVQMQTVWAPAITTMLYLIIFTVALGRSGRTVMGVPFADFIAPGLIIMAMLQNSFANGSFSLMVGKMQGTIVDYLMPPLSVGELMAALAGAAVTRAILVGMAVWFVMWLYPGVHVGVASPLSVLFFGLAGSTMLALLGLLTSLWADKFDQAAMVTNFVVAPLSLLSGTFYSVDSLSPFFQRLSHANPFFYVISGFRHGFLGEADSPIMLGAFVLIGINVVLAAVCYALLRSGWKIKN